jgi:hypothetical protein
MIWRDPENDLDHQPERTRSGDLDGIVHRSVPHFQRGGEPLVYVRLGRVHREKHAACPPQRQEPEQQDLSICEYVGSRPFDLGTR